MNHRMTVACFLNTIRYLKKKLFYPKQTDNSIVYRFSVERKQTFGFLVYFTKIQPNLYRPKIWNFASFVQKINTKSTRLSAHDIRHLFLLDLEIYHFYWFKIIWSMYSKKYICDCYSLQSHRFSKFSCALIFWTEFI